MSAETRLAVYGSLAPGKSNHHQLAGLAGTWKPGVVRGEVFEEGWGALQGYPGLRLDPAGREIAVQVFTSPDLPAHWARLDGFEGAEYRRVVTAVICADGPVEANIYVIAKPKG